MSFEPKVWLDRHSEFPTRRQMTPVPGQEGVYELARAEGIVYQDGDPFDQAQMNGLEGRVAAAFDQLESGAQKAGHALLADKAPWGGISDRPATYPPVAHTHTRGQITDFPASLPANGGNADTVDGYHIAGIGTSAPGSLANNALFFVYE